MDKKDATLNLRLPADVKEALQRAAAKDDRSASSLAVRVLREWLTAEGHLRRNGGRHGKDA
jgi:uncharacterized protein (DUF1778 family)